MREKFRQVATLAKEELGATQAAQYDAQVQLWEFAPGQNILLLLPSSADKFLAKWQRPYEVCSRHRQVDYDIHIPQVGIKQYHVNYINILKEWKERHEALDDPEDTLAGWEMNVDWDEQGQQ